VDPPASPGDPVVACAMILAPGKELLAFGNDLRVLPWTAADGARRRRRAVVVSRPGA